MKANRKAFNNDEEAVSPVIAVILMVAITVVLAATVFVLVNELGQDVGSTGPNIGLSTHTGSTDSDKWTISLTSVTRDVAIDEYTFILTVNGESNSTQWVSSSDEPAATHGEGGYLRLDPSGSDEQCYRITHTDISGDGRLGAGDRLVLTVDEDEDECDDTTPTGGANAFEDDMSNRHELELLHRPTGSGSGSLTRNF